MTRRKVILSNNLCTNCRSYEFLFHQVPKEEEATKERKLRVKIEAEDLYRGKLLFIIKKGNKLLEIISAHPCQSTMLAA